MPKATEADAVIEALDHLLEVQEQHGEVLTHLERRPTPDMDGLARRLEEVADAVERLKPAEVPKPAWWRLPAVVGGMLLLGWLLCWGTIRWMPSDMLPPGFSRVAPPTQKGRF
ncbi:MAG TPA: hypothetical protein VI542_04340 [Candidatus Tectomicrobia bacterium]